MSVTAKQLFKVLQKPAVAEMLAKEYPRIAAFTEAELQDFLDGKDGASIPTTWNSITRSYQAVQVWSAIGAYMVERGTADAETEKAYKELWKIQLTGACKYCHKPINFKLMFKQDVCTKKGCRLAAFRDSV